MHTLKLFLSLAGLIWLVSCTDDTLPPPPVEARLTPSEILTRLQSDYELMPEEQIVMSGDSSTFAQYASPTERYAHGVFGDVIEAGQLIVALDGVIYEEILEETFVYEDLRPRLSDVDGDGVLEIITIRAHVDLGAALVIYKVIDGQLVEYTKVPEIGIPNRWLNPVATHDLDGDGQVEIAWIQTPHIGGILKVARFSEGELTVLSETSLYSNHDARDKNLCLSVLTRSGDDIITYVPSQNRDRIVGFSLIDDRLVQRDEIIMEVDFTVPLADQYPFTQVIPDDLNCINP